MYVVRSMEVQVQAAVLVVQEWLVLKGTCSITAAVFCAS
jgi:hypothetical protein